MTEEELKAITACAALRAVWDELDDLMGGAATATLLGRAARRAARRTPEVSELLIRRERFRYELTCPPGWEQAAAEQTAALLELLHELEPLLVELTGSVVLKRLQAVAALSAFFGTKAVEKGES